MSTDSKLENYLSNLDKALGQIPVSDRSDIITEIKSHIHEALDRDPGADIGTILTSLGEADTVANRYLLERGLKPGRPSKSPIVKWLTIGFLGTFGISALLFLAILWKFTPLVKVNEQAGSVSILGGMIDVTDSGRDFEFSNPKETHLYNGSLSIDKGMVERIQVSFKSGKFDFQPSKDSSVQWDCKLERPKADQQKKLENRTLTFDLSEVPGAKCVFKIPAGIPIKVDGTNGKIDLLSLLGNADVTLSSGMVGIHPSPKANYRYTLSVKNGGQDAFVSSEAKDAHAIKVQVTNGKIHSTHDESGEL